MALVDVVVAVLASGIAAFLFGKKMGRKDERIRQDESYIETRKRMDAVHVDSDDAVLRDWLHERGK